uniref:Uncharacterized protein n=1 Tax=Ralstonia solanacearum TaxID=305 RepID=A0A0S4TUF4_RALSL|nr:protein of unknown function [Ralstonia solanacearum]
MSGGMDIAIVGMSCRLPAAGSVASFWRLLLDGQSAIREVPASRWNLEHLYDADPAAPGKVSTRWGGFLDDVEQFDPEFFMMSPEEAMSVDPQQRLILELGWEALENAHIDPHRLRRSETGVYVGISHNDYERLTCSDRTRIGKYHGTGAYQAMAANRLSYFLDVTGPSMTLDTACSSGLVALHTACQHLASGEAPMALVGAVTLHLTPEETMGLTKGRLLSPTGQCRAFDEKANGYVRSEGGVVIVLKPLQAAVADGARVLAVIKGTAVNHNGRSNGLSAPNGPALKAVMERALAAARLQPRDVSFVETHGTGTPLGDQLELKALQAVYGAVDTADPCWLGCLKTNLGHLETTSGLAGLAKAVEVVRTGQVPENLHFTRTAAHLDISSTRLNFPLRTETIARDVRRAAVTSYGFGGANAHAIVENFVPPPAPESQADGPFLLCLSAQREEARLPLLRRYAAFLATTESPMADVAFSAAAGRATFDHRFAIVAADTADAAAQVNAALADGSGWSTAARRPAVVFVLRASGVVPASAWWLRQPVYRTAHARCMALSAASGGSDPQGAAFAHLYALTEVWRSWGVRPTALHGDGVGRLVAAVASGVMTLEAAWALRATGPGEVAEPLAPLRVPIVDAALSPVPPKQLSAYLAAWAGPAASAPAHMPTGVLLDVAATGAPDADGLPVTALKAAFEAGCTIDWRTVYAQEPVSLADLPNTPFVKRRCWVDSVQALPTPATPASLAEQIAAVAPAAVRDDRQHFPVPRPPSVDAAGLRRWLVDQLARHLGQPGEMLDTASTFHDLGVDSALAVQLAADAAAMLSIEVDVTALWNYTHVDALATHLASLAAGPSGRHPDVAPTATIAGADPAAPTAEPIAVVGCAMRFPGEVETLDDFERLLFAGQVTASTVPADRWDAALHFSENKRLPGKTYATRASFLTDVDRFDPVFFGISPARAADIDPQQRLLLETVWRALEDAGIPPSSLAGSRTGVYVGLSSDDYSHASVNSGDLARITAHNALGNARSIAAGRIAYLLDLAGPCMQIDTACSSSLVAVHSARSALLSGEIDLAIVAGANLILSPNASIACSKLRALSPDGTCKPFDANADGYGRGEGVAVIVLRRESVALASGDRIQGLVAGSAVNHDGRSNGLTAPNGVRQEAVIVEALRAAQVTADRVAYVEAHGTGTPLGDPIEIGALGRVYAARGSRAQPLLVGSVKGNLGHLEAAAGLAGLLKLLVIARRRAIPPTVNFKTPSPHIPWGSYDLAIPSEAVTVDAQRPAWMAVSSFGMSGTNCHVIVRAAEAPAPTCAENADLPLLLLSARSAPALRTLLQRHRELIARGTVPLADICRSSRTGRDHHEHRVGLLATTAEQVTHDIDRVLGGEVPTARASGTPSPCLVLDGTSVLVPEAAAVCSHLSEAFGRALAQAVQHGASMAFAHQFAWATMWLDWGVTPRSIAVGGSGREVEAVLAGSVPLADALHRPVRPETSAAQRTAPWRVVAINGVSSSTREDVTAQVDAALRDITGGAPVVLLSLAQSPEEARASAAGIAREVARLFGALYMAGAALPWARLPGGRGPKVPLPGHPFDRATYWHPRATVA